MDSHSHRWRRLTGARQADGGEELSDTSISGLFQHVKVSLANASAVEARALCSPNYPPRRLPCLFSSKTPVQVYAMSGGRRRLCGDKIRSRGPVDWRFEVWNRCRRRASARALPLEQLQFQNIGNTRGCPTALRKGMGKVG